MNKETFISQKIAEFNKVCSDYPITDDMSTGILFVNKLNELFSSIYERGEKSGMEVLEEIKKLN